jgi:FkbH-like protein
MSAAPALSSAAAVADALSRERRAAARAIFEPIATWEKYEGEVAACRGGLDRYLELHFKVFVDCLALYFRTGDRTYKDLYIGEMIQLLTWSQDATAEARIARVRAAVQASARGLCAVARPGLPADALALLAAELADIERVLTTQSKVSLEVLMIGDCLYRDVMSFVMAPAVEDGITIVPTFLTTKNPAELRNELGKLQHRSFDLVFFSPFTYEQSPEYARTLSWHLAAWTPARVRELVDATFDETAKTVDLVSDLFECSIFVHNSANVRRHDGRKRERVKNAMTWPVRSRARTRMNSRLAEHVEKRNAATFEHLFVLDETPLLADPGEEALGRTFYESDEQHPAALGKYLAREYTDILAVHAHLAKKKLVVCDLDETLWKGVIGEGAVEHYSGRQRVLRKLKEKGIVLAINSKNDAANVHWRGGVLTADDFVCAQITWDPKVVNMRRIEKELNLRAKDFVFVDDRADEREMISQAFPGLYAMDATAERTWSLLERWAAILRAPDEDRSQFYKQREARQVFLDAGGTEDPSRMLETLGLEVTIRKADKRDLPRVAELINRTSQFNTCGTRTSLREVTEWHESPSHDILVVDARDKFGKMGTVSIAVVHERTDRLEIPVFVLSCRVFGYRIEDVVLNQARRRAAQASLPVVGYYKETPHNGPCCKVYPENGFTWDGGAWVLAATGDSPITDPRWLRVHNEDAA